MNFLIVCVFRDGAHEKSYDLYIAADDRRQAVIDALRLVKNRQDQMPDIFGKLLCLKAYRHAPSPIDKDGNYKSSVYEYFEWKHDWVGPGLDEIASEIAVERTD